MVVRVVGLEPTLLAEPDFESGASTSSTTPAASGPPTRTRYPYQHGWAAANGQAAVAMRWMPHSTLALPDQRPARASSPAPTARVQVAQPIER